MSAQRAACLGFALSLGAACSRPQPPKTDNKDLPQGTLAQVGAARVAAATVERIAVAQDVPPKTALERAVSDALFAEEANQRLSDFQRSVAARAARARALLAIFARDAEASGAATDAELKEVISERWNEFDRPESVRVTHAVALAKPEEPKRAGARKLAEAIRTAVDGLTDPAAFLRAAKAVPTAGIKVVAERLPFITEDGRSLTTDAQHLPGADYDVTFAKAANALKAPGTISGVVESPFGFHIILLEARLPAQKVPLDDLRRALHAEVLSRRAGRAREQLLQSLRQSTRVELARDAEQVTQKLVR
ncbi:MAG: peptidylprolyl isomerase [Myxococcota bacterium]